MRRKFAWLFASLVVCLAAFTIIVSCSTEDTTIRPTIQASHVKVSALIGPEGGMLVHPAGAQIVVPPGALLAPVTLTIEGIDAPSGAALGAGPVGQGFQLTPDGQKFLEPVELTLPFDATLLTAGGKMNSVQVFFANAGSQNFFALDSTADLAKGKVTTGTTHFTQFVPAQNPNPVFITTASPLPLAAQGEGYELAFAVSGGTAPYLWSLASGSTLPGGLTLPTDGLLSGAPTAGGGAFFVLVTDSAGHNVQKAFELEVTPAATPVPVLTSISPSTAPQGSANTSLVLTGSSFVSSSKATWNGMDLATTFVNGTQLSAVIPTALLATVGTAAVGVTTPGGGMSSTVNFKVTAVAQNAAPTVTSISPTNLSAGSPDTQITIHGTGFFAQSTGVIGSQGLATQFVNSTSLQAIVPASYLATAGTVDIGVFNPAPGGGTSNALAVTVGQVNLVPKLLSLQPASTPAGSASFTLTLNGSAYVNGGQAFFGATALSTTFVSATVATATVPANLVATVTVVQVTYVNPAPGGGSSLTLPFTVTGTTDAGTDAGTDSAADAIADAVADAIADATPDAVADASDAAVPTAKLRVLHLAPDVAAADFCVATFGGAFTTRYMNSVGVPAGLTYQQASEYVPVAAGSRYTVRLVAAGATDCTTALNGVADVSTAAALPVGRATTIAALGEIAGASPNPLALKEFTDRTTPGAANTMTVRVVNAAPARGGIDFGASAYALYEPQFTGLAFGAVPVAGNLAGTGLAVDANGYFTSTRNAQLFSARQAGVDIASYQPDGWDLVTTYLIGKASLTFLSCRDTFGVANHRSDCITTGGPGAPPSAPLRFLNLAMNTPAVDVCVKEQTAPAFAALPVFRSAGSSAGVAYQAISQYFAYPEGALDVRIVAASSTSSCTTALANMTLNSLGSATFAFRETAFSPITYDVISYGNSNLVASLANFRFHHATTSTNVDLYATPAGGAAVRWFNNVGPFNARNYYGTAAATYSIQLRVANTATQLLLSPGVVLAVTDVVSSFYYSETAAITRLLRCNDAQPTGGALTTVCVP